MFNSPYFLEKKFLWFIFTLINFCLVARFCAASSDPASTLSNGRKLYAIKETAAESVSATRLDYIKTKRATLDLHHKLIFALKQLRLDELEAILYDVSSMDSPNYGQHKTFEEIGSLVSNPTATAAVTKWLTENQVNIITTTTYGEYIICSATVSTWEHLLQTEFHEYEKAHVFDEETTPLSDHKSRNRPSAVIRAESYSLPIDLHDHVTTIFYSIDLPPRVATRSKLRRVPKENLPPLVSESNDPDLDNLLADSILSSFPTQYVYPQTLNKMYSIAGTGNGLGSQAVYESLSQTFLASDLVNFQVQFGIPNDPVDYYIGPFPNASVCNSNADDCGEASLDVQYILAVGRKVPTTYWYDSSGDGSFLTFLTNISNTANPCNIYSISYSAYESDIGKTTLATFNTEAMKLGARGVTLIASSGDDGVTGFKFDSATKPLSQCGYYAQWPASSPYVTAVGGTMNGITLTGTPEIVCSSDTGSGITSGGGFSNSIPAPSFQKAAIANYTSKYKAVQSTYKAYNTSNRGYPDISMAANSYLVNIGGSYYLVDGTSASAPVFAGLVALVNSNRIQRGLSALGWVNPTIYSNNGGFANDITSGNNNCTKSASRCCSIGFQAKVGWDPTTGFGSVNYTKFLQFYANQPSLPTYAPTPLPVATQRPSSVPSKIPSSRPSARPSTAPSLSPGSSSFPTAQPTVMPISQPTGVPTTAPTSAPVTSSSSPTTRPTSNPSVTPSPSIRPSSNPTLTGVTSSPSSVATSIPTSLPSISSSPSTMPTVRPLSILSQSPSSVSSSSPTSLPSLSYSPSIRPSSNPTLTGATSTPSSMATSIPTSLPSISSSPSTMPTARPTSAGQSPSSGPTVRPTSKPSSSPSIAQSNAPTQLATSVPTLSPNSVSHLPSAFPSNCPSVRPTARPSSPPTESPVTVETRNPSSSITNEPTTKPSHLPSLSLSPDSSHFPTTAPTTTTSTRPSPFPTSRASNTPTTRPSAMPSNQPSSAPTYPPVPKTVSYYNIAFIINQILSSEVTATQFLNDPSAVQALYSIILEILKSQGISSAKINSAMDVSSTEVLSMTNGRSLIATQSSSVFLMVNYTVNFATENGNISNIADVLHANVSKQLNVSVTSGQFTTLLSQSNSSSLQTMTSSVVPIVPAAVIVFVPSSSSSSGQGSSMILLAAIAGGGVAGFLVIGGLIGYYFYARHVANSKKTIRTTNPFMVEVRRKQPMAVNENVEMGDVYPNRDEENKNFANPK